ncbi:MAG: hypothetical protein IGS48_17140 [Oscillatoriales cyanobacterium C42_A2020_001]|nr:hypothetical protein [Leptolyngbyaceae cyanobacterium C42_A2020_001]
MEDLAYIYLALNEEAEVSASDLDTPPSQYSLSHWAPPLVGDRASGAPAHPPTNFSTSAPKAQDLDVDFDPHSCPSCFYL